ncbi:unnamed protein product [Kuraishia capsulata CBS 1993]|uniref:CCZ1/INTU/HSP4 first Longin domain-containing protein n=1 Tax=Kuraishia capsulata CBS 1993 TaxID=1382522 RepID=W6MU23_9ASCO|nr:uncharacterized protein KUCA_T00006013001 [Kuraishia capsulata CBS 1993]CDK30018.1 unnamed protein product [Kuraishia capsulata CBS 1993]
MNPLINFQPRGLMSAVEPQPPKLLYLAMYSPGLANTPGQPSDEEGFLRRQVLFYCNFETREVMEDEILKTVGMIQGINDFSAKFNESSYVSHIDTDKTRCVIANIEADFWLVMGIRLASSVSQVDGKTEFVQRGLASPEYLQSTLVEGYRLWRLHHGLMAENLTCDGLEDVKKSLEQWWKSWALARFESESNFNFSQSGFLKLLDGYKKSSMRLPPSFAENMDIKVRSLLKEEGDDVDLLIMNTNRYPLKNFGLVYKNPESELTTESLADLVNYLESLDLSVGLSPSVLVLDNQPFLKELNRAIDADSEQSFSRFFERSLLNPTLFIQAQLTNVFNPLSLTLDAVSSLTSMTTRYIPLPKLDFWNTGTADSDSQQPAQQPGPAKAIGKFILGKHSGHVETPISCKILRVSKKSRPQETTEQALVLYEVCGMLFVMLLKPDAEKLADKAYYDRLETQLMQLYETYLGDLTIQQMKDMEIEAETGSGSTKSPFYYVIHDPQTRTYESSFPTVPDDENSARLKLALQTALLAEPSTETQPHMTSHEPAEFPDPSTMSRSQTIHLHNCIARFALQNYDGYLGLYENAKLFKTGKNWWILQQSIPNSAKTLLIARRFEQKDARRLRVLDSDLSLENKADPGLALINSLGQDVLNWYCSRYQTK